MQALYIPLCLYFNACPSIFDNLSAIFTFHYVSILMNFSSSILSIYPFFTFHYVSILISVFCSGSSASAFFTFHYVSILIQEQDR